MKRIFDKICFFFKIKKRKDNTQSFADLMLEFSKNAIDGLPPDASETKLHWRHYYNAENDKEDKIKKIN